jgi:hypothetical protein
MTITAVATAAPLPLTHPFWCQTDRCVNAEGESMVHQHLIGKVGGVEVVVERIDDYDADYRPRTGEVEVNVFTRSEQGMSPGQVDDLTRTLNAAKVFAVEVA